MYSSPLTGLTVQYDRRICEDDDNWVSTLDSSVGCSSLSPTDERCHHYDVNGDTGYESCPKSCGNCFEDSDSPSDDSNGIGSQPIGLYEGENGETNEFDPLGSSSRGRGDLEDLVYKFTYEINDKINELSDKIDDFKDNTNSRIDDNEEANRGICYKMVCTNKTEPPPTGDTTTGDTTTGGNTGSQCSSVTADICSRLTYTDCEQNTCCKLKDGSDGFPEYTRANSIQEESRDCGDNYFYSPVSRDVVDNEIINYQNQRSSPNSRTDSGTTANTRPSEPTFDFTITINGGSVRSSNPVKRGNITYIPISETNNPNINTARLDGNHPFFQDKIVSFAAFNTHKGSITFDITSSPSSSSWTKYHFDNDMKLGDGKDCLILKIALSDTDVTNMCYNDDNIPKPAYCDIFYDKDASYYIYTFGTDSQSVNESLKYGDFYYATKTDNEKLTLKKILMTGDPATNVDTVTYKKDKNKHDIRTTQQEFIGPKIVGLYFLYNINILFLSTQKAGENSVSIRPTPLTITIEYPLEDDNKDMGKKIVNINDIFAMNDNLMSPSPFLYKIHDFKTDNINLADIKINVDKHYFFVKNHNTKCESPWIDITWWCLFVIITLITVYNLYLMTNLPDTKNIPIIAILAIIMLCVIIIIPLLDRDWRAYIKFGLWWIVFLISIIIYAIDVKPSIHLNTSILLSIVYLINITTYTDFRDKFINPDKKDCDLKSGYPMLYIICAIVMVIVRHYYLSSQQVDKKSHLIRKIVGSLGIAIYFIFSDNNTIDIISEWFGYYDTSSMWIIFIFLRDFFILV